MSIIKEQTQAVATNDCHHPNTQQLHLSSQIHNNLEYPIYYF